MHVNNPQKWNHSQNKTAVGSILKICIIKNEPILLWFFAFPLCGKIIQRQPSISVICDSRNLNTGMSLETTENKKDIEHPISPKLYFFLAMYLDLQ